MFETFKKNITEEAIDLTNIETKLLTLVKSDYSITEMNFEILKQSITEIIGDKTINSNEKESGVVYTPPHIVMHMITELDIKKGETIIEPSVGHGMFVFHLIQYFVSKFNFAQVLELKSYVKKHVWGRYKRRSHILFK